MTRAALPALLCALSVGCAAGRVQRVSFVSDPERAAVVVGAKTVGETPVTVKLERSGGQVLTFAKDGYKPVTVRTAAPDGWFGGRLDMDVFGSMGTVEEYAPGRYRVTLPSDGTAPIEALPEEPKPLEASLPGPAPSDWPAECRAASGKEAESYCLLIRTCRGGTREAERYMAELDYRAKTRTVERVSRHILSAKGATRLMSWSFGADPALPSEEKACIAWFLGRYTAYRSAGAPEE